MLIAAAPNVIPVSTANPPTEAVASEAAQKPPIPEMVATAENPNSKNSTDSNNLDKPDNGQRNDTVKDKNGENSEQSSQQDKREKQEPSQEELRQIRELKKTDREVRAHEAAHASVGGQYAGAPSYEYVKGSDGRRYAVAGQVSIDTSKIAGDPQATIEKMQQVQRAALAPSDPSSQDLKVAAMAAQIANQATIELNIQKADEGNNENSGKNDKNKNNIGVVFSSPDSTRNNQSSLNQKIINSGAFENTEVEPLFSYSA